MQIDQLINEVTNINFQEASPMETDLENPETTKQMEKVRAQMINEYQNWVEKLKNQIKILNNTQKYWKREFEVIQAQNNFHREQVIKQSQMIQQLEQTKLQQSLQG